MSHQIPGIDPNKTDRRKYYAPEERAETIPDKADWNNHTMGKDNFRKYIGRVASIPADPNNRDFINCKKFTEEQKSYLKRAYAGSNQVIIIGAEKNDFDTLLDIYNRNLVTRTNFEINSHLRLEDGKLFNNIRATMCWVLPKTLNSTFDSENIIVEYPNSTKNMELWVIVFPSPQYVDQIGELIRAIYDDFRNSLIKSDTKVKVWHFAKLENEVAKWTQLETEVSAFVRHGDTVVIGNVELLLPGIIEVGYHKKFENWKLFGLNNMFGIQILINDANHARIILLGIRECFWGQASAFYTAALLRLGVRHILYGSKAGTMSDKLQMSTLKSPSSFSVFAKHDINLGLNDLTSTITSKPALRRLANLLSIDIAGINATVPTVIGETMDQRNKFANLNPSTMDDEDGYIAAVVESHNKTFSIIDEAGFLPVHYISDYIHKPGEEINPEQTNLAKTEIVPRNEAFKKAGGFFGVYASIYGLIEYVLIDKFIPKPHFEEIEVDKLLKKTKSFLDMGMIREAISTLSKSQVHSGPNLQAIALICQKYGFIDDAINILDVLKEKIYWETIINAKNKIRIQIMETRLYTQIGDFSKAEIKIDQIFADDINDSLKDHEQYNSLCRRKALTIAIKNHNLTDKLAKENWQLAEMWFTKAKENNKDETDKNYETATNSLYYLIALLAVKDRKKVDYEKEMTEARLLYLQCTKSKLSQVTSLEKSMITALFVEAAHHLLAHGIDDNKGLMRLYLAHIYNTRIGGSERSEGYGELIAFIPDQAIKDLFRRAMRIDENGKRDFQKSYEAKRFWKHIHDSLDIFDHPVTKRAKKLNVKLARFDELLDKEERVRER